MTTSSATRLWREKLVSLQKEEAIAIDAAHKFKLVQEIAEAKAKLAVLEKDTSGKTPWIAPTKLTHVAASLFGRDDELARLDAAWDDPGTHVVTLVAWGGVGKTSLVGKWTAGLSKRDFDGGDYFDWSFYNQGTGEQGAPSADPFVAAALEFFGDPEMAKSTASPWDKGARLARLVARRRTLLVLDGLEPLQRPPGSLAGKLKEPALTALLKGLAARNPGLCLATTRLRIEDLAPFRDITALDRPIAHLSTAVSVELLKDLGVHGTEAQLKQLVKDVKGHALTLQLLGRYLARAHGGDVSRRDCVDLAKADLKIEGGHAFKTMSAYEDWLASGGDEGTRQLAVMRCLGVFDRPADADCLAALRRRPIVGLTEPLVGLDEDDWNLTVAALADCALVSYEGTSLDAHPLIREHFARQLREHHRDAWRSAHYRLFEHLQKNTEEQPNTLAGLQPFYAAIFHGCQAGRYSKALDVYWKRIVRERKMFTRRARASDPDAADAPGTNLGALAHFFSTSWSQPKANLDPEQELFLLEEAGHYLFLLGRPLEAVPAMHAALERNREGENWDDACKQARLLREVHLTLGNLEKARTLAEESRELADRSEVPRHRMATMAGLGQVCYYLGEYTQASQAFELAEELQKQRRPKEPRLSYIWGFWYCEFLLGLVEAQTPSLGIVPSLRSPGALLDLDHTEERAQGALALAEKQRAIFDIAHDKLTLSRVDFLRALHKVPGKLSRAVDPMNEAVEGLRQTGQQPHLLVGLLSRAALRRSRRDFTGAEADLTEVEEIAKSGSMRLYLVDVYLERARLFLSRKKFRLFLSRVNLSRAQKNFKAAAELIRDIGYRRREKEMKTLETMLKRKRASFLNRLFRFLASVSSSHSL